MRTHPLRAATRPLALAALLFSLTPGCNTELAPRGTPPLDVATAPLVGGSYTYERPEVGSMQMGGGACTATLVGPRLAITASHCVDYTSREPVGNYGTFEIRRARGDSHTYRIQRIAAYMGPAEVIGQTDVALLELATAVPADIATPAGLVSREPASGTSVTIYGYGCQYRGGSGAFSKQSYRTRWGATTAVLCPGDSGGPTMTDDGLVISTNSGYYGGDGGPDEFGRVYRVRTQIDATVARWGETLGSGSTPPPPVADAGPLTSDGGPIARDAGPPPPPPMTDPSNPCLLPSCGEATALPGCGWCDATAHGIRVGAMGEALEPCASGYRLDPADCGASAPRSTCGPWSGITEFTCRRGRTQFVRCIEGSAPEFLACPSGYVCSPGSTERMCWR